MKEYITKFRDWLHARVPLHRKKKRHLSSASVAAMTAGIVLFVCIFAFYQYRQYAGTPLKVLDDSSITFSGYNGNGIVQDDFHPEQAMLDELSETIARKDAAGESTIYISQLKDSIICGFNKDQALSNDEVITYSCTIDEDLARNAGYHLVNTQKNYKVEGLANLTPVDPFIGVTAEWVMQDGAANLEINIPDNLQALGITYSSETRNETTITLTASANEEQLSDDGYVLAATSKDYVVGTKPSLITSLHELSDDETDMLISEAEKLLEQELETCGYTLLHDSRSLAISGFEEGRIEQSHDGFTVSFTLLTDNLPWYSRFSSLYADFTGTVYRSSDSTVHFSSSTKHSCTVGGFFSLYMEEASAS